MIFLLIFKKDNLFTWMELQGLKTLQILNCKLQSNIKYGQQRPI